MMKKIVTMRAFLLIFVAVVLLSGCGNDQAKKDGAKSGTADTGEPAVSGVVSQEDKETSPTSDQKIHIKFWDYTRNKEVTQWEEEQIKKFEQMHPECKVDLTRIAWTEGQLKIQLAYTTGEPPDVAASGFLEQFLPDNAYEPIDDVIKDEIDDFYPIALKAFEYRGKHYAIPWYMTAYVLVLNLDYFEQYGVKPPENGLWTVEEFDEALKKFTYNEDGSPTGIKGMTFTVTEGHFEAWGFLYTQGVRILDEKGEKCVFNSPRTVNALTNLINFEKNRKVAHSASGSFTQEESWSNFYRQRKSAISPQGIWAISALKKHNEYVETGNEKIKKEYEKRKLPLPEKPFNFQVALFPYVKGKQPIVTSAGVGQIAVFKQKDDRKRKLCFELVKMFADAEGQKFFALAQSQFPTRRSAGNLYENDPYLSRIQPYMEEAVFHPCHPAWNRIDAIVQKYIQLALMGTMKVEDAIAEAQKEIDAILAKYSN